jgi:hypothetical protein
MTETFVPPRREAIVAPDARWVRDYRNYALGTAFVATFFAGLARALQRTELELLVAVTLASALVLYVMLDAKLHGKVFERGFMWVFWFTWPLAIFVHFFWTRRFRGLLVALGWGTLALVTALLGAGLGALIKAL